jgi:multimeric flavodoxin WrbA
MAEPPPRAPLRAVVLDSLPDSSGAFVEGALEGRGVTVVRHELRQQQIAACRSCFACWIVRPGCCVVPDDGARVVADAIASDVLVLVTRPTFGGFSSRLKRAMDRMIGIMMPFQVKRGAYSHHPARYRSMPHLVALAVGGTTEEQSLLTKLVGRLAAEYQCSSSWVGGVPTLTPVTASEAVAAFLKAEGTL